MTPDDAHLFDPGPDDGSGTTVSGADWKVTWTLRSGDTTWMKHGTGPWVEVPRRRRLSLPPLWLACAALWAVSAGSLVMHHRWTAAVRSGVSA